MLSSPHEVGINFFFGISSQIWHLQASEFLNENWKTPKQKHKSPNLLKAMERLEKIKNWVLTSILQLEVDEKKEKQFAKFITIAMVCYWCGVCLCTHLLEKNLLIFAEVNQFKKLQHNKSNYRCSWWCYFPTSQRKNAIKFTTRPGITRVSFCSR